MNLDRFRYTGNRKLIEDDSLPDTIPETPPRSSFSTLNKKTMDEKVRESGKRKLISSSDEEESEQTYQRRKKTRITHFLKKKPVEAKPSSSAFISPESGSDEDDDKKAAVNENGYSNDIQNNKVIPSPRRESQNSVSSETCESPMIFSRKNKSRFRLDSNEKEARPENEKIHGKNSCKRLGLSSSESEDENEEDSKPKGPFPRLNCIVSNSNDNNEREQTSNPKVTNGHSDSAGTRLVNGNGISSFYSKKNKSPKSSGKKHKDKKLKSFAGVCSAEDKATDENFSIESDYESSSDEDEFAHYGIHKKKRILDFFQNATKEELSSIQGCSNKKADLIVGLQPFNSWNDLVHKLSKTKFLNCDIVSKCDDLLKERRMLESLLKECRSISDRLNSEIECLRLQDHMTKGKMVLKAPVTIPSHLQLKPYQLVGLNWVALLHRNGVNGVLADEMGLGKTVQTISFLAHLFEDDPSTGPHLVVVPSSTLDNWCREFSLWCPTMDVVPYRGSQAERRDIRADFLRGMRTANVILTTYNSAISSSEDRVFFRKIRMEYAVFDEGHMLKNMSSQRYMHLMKIRACRKLLLTGTPLQNNLLELMSLLRFVMPHMFEQTTDTLVRIFSSSNSDNTSKFAQDRIRDAKEIMQPFVLRRLKDDVLKQLPEKQNQVVYCDMTSTQEEQYEDTKDMFRKKLHKQSTSELKNAFIELRKVANHPLLRRKHYAPSTLKTMAKLLKKEPEFRESRETLMIEDMEVMTDFELDRFCRTTNAIRKFALDGDAILNSGKFKRLDSILPEFKMKNERVVIFSQFTMIMDIIEKYLERRDHKYVRLDGQTAVNTRLDIIDQFNRDSSIFVFLLSTKAGGLGINLTSANIVILHDIDMNPYNDKQAEDRCHRLGQTKTVKIIRLLSKGTIEEGMLRCAENKLKLEQEMTGNGDDSNDIASLLEETLAS